MRRSILGGVVAMLAAPVLALDDGAHGVWLQAQDGTQIHIASLELNGGVYDLTLEETPFSDHFLSMRPFKCVEGPDMLWCHVPYPYEIKRDISTETTDLEYDFLFLWKRAGSYGIDMWNGIYYELEAQDNGLIGHVHEMDMNTLSVPPEAGNFRPLQAKHLEPGDPDSHWLPHLVIKPK